MTIEASFKAAKRSWRSMPPVTCALLKVDMPDSYFVAAHIALCKMQDIPVLRRLRMLVVRLSHRATDLGKHKGLVLASLYRRLGVYEVGFGVHQRR